MVNLHTLWVPAETVRSVMVWKCSVVQNNSHERSFTCSEMVFQLLFVLVGVHEFFYIRTSNLGECRWKTFLLHQKWQEILFSLSQELGLHQHAPFSVLKRKVGHRGENRARVENHKSLSSDAAGARAGQNNYHLSSTIAISPTGEKKKSR